MQSAFLQTTDVLISGGLRQFSPQFISAQARYVESLQLPDGGFPGRIGKSDTYYTNFAVRTLFLLDPDNRALARTADYVRLSAPPPLNIVECFCYLNTARLLGISIDITAVENVLLRQYLPSKGFSRPGGKEISAYNTFLAVLCLDMLDREITSLQNMIEQVRNLECKDGGYCETPGEIDGQTNATAAALAFLRIVNALEEDDIRRAEAFFRAMQSENGGIRAQTSAPQSDLLSTFTALLSLCMLTDPTVLNLAQLARFIRATASPTGGFRACISDTQSDAEYTYYGIGTLALLRSC